MFKNFAIAAAAVAMTASAASAASWIGNQDGFAEGDHSVEVSTVRADAAGTLQIESLQGDVLGTAMVNAGANGDVLVPLGKGLTSDVVAKLIVDGEVADELRIEVR